MTVKEQATALIGVFEDHREAEHFMEELRRAGFTDAQMGFVAPHAAPSEAHTEEGAAAGALTGGALGMLAGLAVTAGLFPGIGTALVGGILGSLLSSAATGAAAGGILGALVGLGLSEEEARHYESQIKAGRTLVVVQGECRLPEAVAILHRCQGTH